MENGKDGIEKMRQKYNGVCWVTVATGNTTPQKRPSSSSL